ncbi:MAG: metalloregulator ArsR/SmtB family transcription factor [Microbacteriaceae bacterium]|nr:metalloregulator ArsR/SmtB family transcription factor [Microbacteriaceae bacterium]
MADIFDVISDPTRRELLARLLAAGATGGDVSVGALVEQTGLTQPTVSKHLKVLRDQGLVAVREEAQHRYYRIDPAPLGEVATWLETFIPAAPAAGRVAGEAKGPDLIPFDGTAAADQIGRVAATTMHHARNVLHALQEATEEARERLSEAGDQTRDRFAGLVDQVKQVLPVKSGQ